MGRHGEGMADRLVRAGVTEREAEVLGAVAERLRNREIADRLHVSVRTVESHIAALLRKLDVTDRAALAEVGVQLRRTNRADTALPVPLTSLVGRENDARELATLVDAHRLVTLIGPAGVGKTRLALYVGAFLAGRYRDGARLADLAPVDAALVGDTVARGLGVVPMSGWPLQDVLREVAGEMRCLLVVDNCEHVVTEAADIVADLLAAGTELRVLATSREPLGVPGEVAYPVRPLPVPDLDGGSPAPAASYDAVRLFVERAATASPGFVLTEAAAPAVTALCQRLDGLPLAIELAASRVRTFGPDELVAHLDQRFELLTAGARTALPRHRTLRAAIDWSYHLLADDERALFDRLGVFPADFDFEAAQAVGATSETGRPAVITLLPRLVDKSLVSAIAGRRTGRYRLLETIRAYAAECLAASGTESGARQRHADHYLALAERAAEHLCTAQQRTWLDRLTEEQPNLRAALAHSIAAAEPDAAWRWVAALERFWDVTGRREAQDWIERALAIGDPPATPTAVAGVVAASHIMQPTNSRAAFDLAQRAAQLAAGLDDLTRARASRAVGMGALWIQPELVVPVLHEALAGFGHDHPWESALTMQNLVQATGELTEALDWGRAAVALFRDSGDAMYAANTLFIMAQRAMYADVADDEVHEWLSESRALAEATGSAEDQAHASVGFGYLAWLRGDHDHAAQLMEQCLPALRRLGDLRCTGRALYLLGQRAHEQRRLDLAEQQLAASVEAVALAGQSFVLVNALEALASVQADEGRPRQAAVLLGTAYAAREVASAHMRPIQPPDERLRRSLVRTLGTAAFDTAHTEGMRLSPIQALQSVRVPHS
jgi:predicted ATPase/DNA-binding CsgD family transcriptional regulator